MPPSKKNPPVDKGKPPRANVVQAFWVSALLLLAIGLIYGQTLGHAFLNFDDNGYVFANPHVSRGLTAEGIWWAFTDGPYGEWYPLAMLSHMLDCQLFGLEPWGHHLTSVLLHAAGSIALFLVLWRMTDELWPSAFAAALFAVHPQHVESVAWIAERRDVLSGLFFMLTLGAWLRYVRSGRSVSHYALVALLFALALMSKPMVVTLPPLLLLLDFWPLARFGSATDTPRWTASLERPGLRELILEKLPLVALAAGDVLMTLRTHNAGGALLPWSQRMGNAAVSAVTYVVQFFFPFDLAAYYPVPPAGWPQWKVAAAVALLALVSTAAIVGRRRCPYLFVGWFWYLGMLSPVLGLIQVSSHAMADRYMYLPGIGLYIALAWAGTRLAADSPARRRALGACAGLAIVVLVACAMRQASTWRNDESLWTHALQVTHDNGEAEFNLSFALAQQRRLDEAIVYLRRAEQHATDISPFINLGLILTQQGKLDEAIDQYRQALERDSQSILAARAHFNLASVLASRGQIHEAAAHYRQALEIEPSNSAARRNLENLYRTGPGGPPSR
ncbi:MAG TPA: tetratricopeptide repeat protein [Pirellulales bacterium]|jgi:hypothetical protein|nr:tetratricopeptide repeat protein [Pirellulales bacterium]